MTDHVELESLDIVFDYLEIPLDITEVIMFDRLLNNMHVSKIPPVPRLQRALDYCKDYNNMLRAYHFILNQFRSHPELEMKTFVEFVSNDDLRNMSKSKGRDLYHIGHMPSDKLHHTTWFGHPMFQKKLGSLLKETQGVSCNWIHTDFEVRYNDSFL